MNKSINIVPGHSRSRKVLLYPASQLWRLNFQNQRYFQGTDGFGHHAVIYDFKCQMEDDKLLKYLEFLDAMIKRM